MNSTAFTGVCDSQGRLSAGGGVGVLRRTSRFESTASGSYGTSPEPLKAPEILLDVIDALNAVRKAGRNSCFVTWLMPQWMRFEIWLPYASFNGAKQPISSG